MVQTISVVNKTEKSKVCPAPYKSVFYGVELQLKENVVHCSHLLTCFLA